MYIPLFLHAKKSHDVRTEFLLSYVTIFNICFSSIYFIAIIYDIIRFQDKYVGFSFLFGLIIFLFFIFAYVAKRKRYLNLSIIITALTIVSVCTASGIRWGFDMPFTLLGYILGIVIVGMVGTKKQNIFHIVLIIGSMFLGQIYRNSMIVKETWHGTIFGFTDMFEVLIIFGTITTLLVFSHRAEQNLLNRAKRTEYLLKKERDLLEIKIEEKISELKKIQLENLSTMYRFVEFGKISSGLFHDLMSPVQTLKIYMDSFPKDNLDPVPYKQIEQMQKVSLKIEKMLETMRKQIRFNQNIEDFDLLQEIRDILLITKHLYLSKNISININCSTDVFVIKTKRIMLNHVLLNIISNACESCIDMDKENVIDIHVGKINHEKFKTYISIADTGSGISKKDIEHVFDNFYSTKSAKSMNCGIGLSSSKYTIEKHLSGKLLVESQEGVGTTMTILLP